MPWKLTLNGVRISLSCVDEIQSLSAALQDLIWISPSVIAERMEAVLEDARVLLCDRKISALLPKTAAAREPELAPL